MGGSLCCLTSAVFKRWSRINLENAVKPFQAKIYYSKFFNGDPDSLRTRACLSILSLPDIFNSLFTLQNFEEEEKTIEEKSQSKSRQQTNCSQDIKNDGNKFIPNLCNHGKMLLNFSYDFFFVKLEISGSEICFEIFCGS